MANFGLYLLLLFFSFHLTNKAESAHDTNRNPSGTNFIKASCRATLYPVLCFQSLSSYATKIQQNERELAQAALSVSLKKARFTTMFVARMIKVAGIKPREYRAVMDCIDNMGDTVDQLSRSLRELEHMGRVRGQSFMWHMSNVQTWVSAALTDENTCLDGFSERSVEGNVKAAIKRRVTNVTQVTSNGLALVNRFAERHQPRAAAGGNLP